MLDTDFITDFSIDVIASLNQIQVNRLRIICDRFGFSSSSNQIKFSLLVEAYKNGRLISFASIIGPYEGQTDPKAAIEAIALSLFPDDEGRPLTKVVPTPPIPEPIEEEEDEEPVVMVDSTVIT